MAFPPRFAARRQAVAGLPWPQVARPCSSLRRSARSTTGLAAYRRARKRQRASQWCWGEVVVYHSAVCVPLLQRSQC